MLNIASVEITADQVLSVLMSHKGRGFGLHMRDLVKDVTHSLQAGDVVERKVRDLIQQLRMQGHLICGHPATGYYLAESQQEIDDTCMFLLARVETTIQQIAAMRRVAAPDLYQQLGINRPRPPSAFSI